MNNEDQSHDVSFTPASGFRLFIPQDSTGPLERGDTGDLRIRSMGRADADGLLCQWDIPIDQVISFWEAEWRKRNSILTAGDGGGRRRNTQEETAKKPSGKKK